MARRNLVRIVDGRIVHLSCRCGTGNYCHVHHKYDVYRASGEPTGARCLDPEDFQYEQCGGGRRVIRKAHHST